MPAQRERSEIYLCRYESWSSESGLFHENWVPFDELWLGAYNWWVLSPVVLVGEWEGDQYSKN